MHGAAEGDRGRSGPKPLDSGSCQWTLDVVEVHITAINLATAVTTRPTQGRIRLARASTSCVRLAADGVAATPDRRRCARRRRAVLALILVELLGQNQRMLIRRGRHL